MKQNKNIYGPAFIAGLCFLLSCFTSGQNQKTVVFPFNNKIYTYLPGTDELVIAKKTKYLFSKNFYTSGKISWISGSMAGNNARKVLVEYNTETNQIKEILTGQYQKIIPVRGIVITVSAAFRENEGFLYEFYSLDKKRFNKQQLYAIYCDLFLSDIEVISNTVIAAGYDSAGADNLLVLFDPGARVMRLLIKEQRKKNFLKLIQTGKSLIYYPSSQDWQEGTDIHFRELSFSVLNAGTAPTKHIPGECAVQLPVRKYALYGKGFYAANVLYLPVLDKEYNTGLLKITESESAFQSAYYPLFTGIYAPFGVDPGADPGYLNFLGYNYYKDKDRFYFFRLPGHVSSVNPEDIRYLPLDF